MRLEFLNVCNDVTKTATKIPQSEYLSKGLYPIYDQGKDVVGGYSNRNDGTIDLHNCQFQLAD